MSSFGVSFTPLVPKKPVIDPQVPNRVSQVMRNAGGTMLRDRKTYPPARPWKGRTPTTGPRAGGRRTGQLARGWTITHGRARWDIFNRTSYAGYVQGFGSSPVKRKRQTGAMAGRGWRSFEADIAKLNQTLGPDLQKAFKQTRR